MAASEEDAVELIRFLLSTGTVILDDIYSPDSCIARTRMAVDFLRANDVGARPMPVAVRAWNQQCWDLIERGVPTEQWPEQAWSVGIGGQFVVTQIDRRDGTKGFDGHLVAYVPMLHAIVDLTLQQMSRPHKDIHLTPAAVKLPHDWDAPHADNFAAVYRDFPGVVVAYQPLKCDPALWRDTPDWRDRRGIVAQLLPTFVEKYAQTREATTVG